MEAFSITLYAIKGRWKAFATAVVGGSCIVHAPGDYDSLAEALTAVSSAVKEAVEEPK